MAWDSTKSAPSAQQPEPSTQCPIPGGYRRAETRHHRIASRPAARGRAATRHDRRDPPSPLRTARNNRMPPMQSPLATAHRAQKLGVVIPSEILSAFEEQTSRGMPSSLEAAEATRREFRWTRDSRRMARAERSEGVARAECGPRR
jgi:hypothetical protein